MSDPHPVSSARHASGGEPRGAGRQGDGPERLGSRAYVEIALRIKDRFKAERVPLLAAGVAFFALLSMVPGIGAVVAVYGLVADPDEVREQVEELTDGMPAETQDLLVTQIEGVIDLGSTGLGLTLLATFALALWSASAGIRYLIEAVQVAYDEDDERGFVAARLQSLLFTLGAVLLAIVALLSMTVLPRIADEVAGGVVSGLVAWLRWPVLGLVALVALGILYKAGPDRSSPRLRWVTPGSVVAVVTWLVGSVGFSVYVTRFGGEMQGYGPLSAVLVTMVWLLISALAVLLGAYVNAELEHQTAVDTTVGEPDPQGERGAVMADHEPVGQR